MSGRDCGHQGSSKRLDATYGSGRRCPKLLPFNLGVADRRLRGGDRSASIAAGPMNRPPRPTKRLRRRRVGAELEARAKQIELIAMFVRPMPTAGLIVD